MSLTPICDFVKDYCKAKTMRLHMPGHKGRVLLGPEALDITEIEGADVLYHANGIIRQSEQIAVKLFTPSAFTSQRRLYVTIRIDSIPFMGSLKNNSSVCMHDSTFPCFAITCPDDVFPALW